MPPNHPSPAGPLHCLVVEDSNVDQRIILRILERAAGSTEILVASTLAEARDMIETHNIRCILLDNRLPDGLGADFAIELSREPKYRRITVMMLTDWPSPFMFDKAKIAGVRAVVDKSGFRIEHARALFGT